MVAMKLSGREGTQSMKARVRCVAGICKVQRLSPCVAVVPSNTLFKLQPHAFDSGVKLRASLLLPQPGFLHVLHRMHEESLAVLPKFP